MSLNPSPALAALLSFLFPGLGQIYAGSLRRGVLWAIPMLLIILAVIWLVLGGPIGMIALISNPQTRVAMLVLNIAFFLYHVAAMVDAYSAAKVERYRGFGRPSATAPIALAVLVALTMVLHGVPEAIGVDASNAIAYLFPGHHDVIPSFSPRPSAAPTPISSITPSPFVTPTPNASDEPTDTPIATSSGPTPTPKPCPPIDLSAWHMADDGRLNLLLTGSDSRSDTGVGSSSIRTDSMMLLTVDIASCKAALFSFPRNMGCDARYPTWFQIPLENGQDYPGCLNALWRDAASSPANYPGSDGIGSECQQQFDCERGWRALVGAIQNMTNTTIDGVISVNLKGFVALVNALPGHGLWIDVPKPGLQDLPTPCPPPNQDKTCHYADSNGNPMNVDLQPGCQFLQPEMALAFARSRHQDSDYVRERRQQIFLQQVRHQLDPLSLLANMNDLLSAAEQNLFMTVDQTDIPYLAQVAARVDADRLYRQDFAPNHLAALNSMDGMAAKVQNIFSEPEPLPDPQDQQNPCPPKNQ